MQAARGKRAANCGSDRRGRGAIEMTRKLAYTAVALLPAMCLTAGCGEPPPPPPEAAGEDVDELEALMEGIELGSETGAPDTGVPADAPTPGVDAPGEGAPGDGTSGNGTSGKGAPAAEGQGSDAAASSPSTE